MDDIRIDFTPVKKSDIPGKEKTGKKSQWIDAIISFYESDVEAVALTCSHDIGPQARKNMYSCLSHAITRLGMSDKVKCIQRQKVLYLVRE